MYTVPQLKVGHEVNGTEQKALMINRLFWQRA